MGTRKARGGAGGAARRAIIGGINRAGAGAVQFGPQQMRRMRAQLAALGPQGSPERRFGEAYVRFLTGGRGGVPDYDNFGDMTEGQANRIMANIDRINEAAARRVAGTRRIRP